MNNTYHVYVHENMANYKKYVGITGKRAPEHRWGTNGAHYDNNKHFYAAIQKYGWDNFEHRILFSGLSEEQALAIEASLIETLKTTDRDFGYNIMPGGSGIRSGEEIYLLSVGREKRTIEKYSSVKECIKAQGLDSHSVITDVLWKTNKIAIKSRYLRPYFDYSQFSEKNEIKLYFNKIGVLITDIQEENIVQVISLKRFKRGGIKIRGIGFLFPQSKKNTIHTSIHYKLCTKERKKSDFFITENRYQSQK